MTNILPCCCLIVALLLFALLLLSLLLLALLLLACSLPQNRTRHNRTTRLWDHIGILSSFVLLCIIIKCCFSLSLHFTVSACQQDQPIDVILQYLSPSWHRLWKQQWSEGLQKIQWPLVQHRDNKCTKDFKVAFDFIWVRIFKADLCRPHGGPHLVNLWKEHLIALGQRRCTNKCICIYIEMLSLLFLILKFRKG